MAIWSDMERTLNGTAPSWGTGTGVSFDPSDLFHASSGANFARFIKNNPRHHILYDRVYKVGTTGFANSCVKACKA